MSSVRRAKNRKQQLREPSDRISILPLTVLQQILECLPLQQAARTSILSKHWRNKWASTSQLILDESFVKSICEKRSEPSAILLAYNKAINDILLSQVGPIGKFVLYIPSWFPKETDFSSWLRFVHGNGVNKITIEDDRGPIIRNVPTCLFSFVRLTDLALLKCKLAYLSPTFRGFPCLINLKFDTRHNVSDLNVLANLISKCPLLERLHLSFGYSFGSLTIRAPKLQDFYFRARCELIDLSLEETRAIKVLSLFIYGQKLQKSRNMADFFSCLANVEKLSLFEAYYLNDFTSPKRFPKSLTRLQVLQLMQIPLNCKSSISLALCLLLSSPNLEQLHIKAMKREVESDDQLNQFDNPCIFRCLKTVHLVGITGLSNELKLIKFLLACSPVLDEMTIELGTEMGVAEKQANFFKELNQYRRASPNAEMIIKT